MQTNLFTEQKQPLVMAHGLGVDSTAVTVGLVNRGIRPDLILHAVTGGDQRHTYAYVPILNAYLVANGFPTVTRCQYVPKNFKNWPPYYTLEENCLTNGTLPSISFFVPVQELFTEMEGCPTAQVYSAMGTSRSMVGRGWTGEEDHRV